jgi:predicted phage gp36 major capsid-like protein
MQLLAELETARAAQRKLQDQLRKTERSLAQSERASQEARRAHQKMVETLTETMRENTALEIERDMWKARAQRTETHSSDPAVPDIQLTLGIGQISEDEASAIRKAIARLHHPDSGGNAERMKQWNAALDRIARGL